MIPVKLKKPVYIRKGPGPSHDKLGVAQPSGKTILMDGVIENGETLKGINKHYYIINDKGEKQYYWSGTFEGQAYNYNQLIQDIPNEWRETKGEGVTVAILDTGCFNHPDLQNKIIDQHNIFDQSNNVTDEAGHGTFIAGIIAANDDALLSIQGIASDVKLIIVKVAITGDSDVFEDNVYNGLLWLSNTCKFHADIINISLDFPTKNNKKFDDIFKKLSDNGSIIFASAQNNEGLLGDIHFPSSNQFLTAIGALDTTNNILNNLKNNQSNKINNKVKYIVPDIIYNSLSLVKFSLTTNQGCSFSTAIISGASSLALSYIRRSLSTLNFSDFFDNNIQSFDPNSFSNNLKIYKL